MPSPVEQAALELRRVGAELAKCDQAIGQFKRAHMAMVNGRACFLSNDISSRPALDNELRSLLRARDKVWALHQAAMAEHARIKLGGAA